jgi:hemerythrin-like domain-containing protein
MDPIEMLMHEHRVIEQVLDALDRTAAGLRAGSSVARGDLGRFIEFLRGFADACHHGKEEDILFAAMAAKGMPVETGPLAVMLHEHEQGRRLIRILADAAGGAGEMAEAERARAADAAIAYTGMLRAHIQKEDQVIYPMAQRLLPPAEWVRIAAAFAEFEAKETGEGEHERLHALAETLAGGATGCCGGDCRE